MKSGAQPGGYTIVETLIFLTVTVVLLMSALLLVGGRQAKTEFTQSVRELESRMLDIINDVSVGYYPTTGKIKCEVIPTGIVITEVVTNQGTNANCTFIGRVVQFAPDGGDGRNIRVYTVVGHRLQSSGQEVTSIEQAKGRAIAKGTNPADVTPDVFEDFKLGPIKVDKVTYKNGASVQPTGGVGFFTTFNSYTGGSLDSGSTTAELAPLPSAPAPISFALGQDSKVFIDNLNSVLLEPSFSGGFNPSGGIDICVQSLGTNQHAILSIGGDSRQLTTLLKFGTGNTCP